MGRILLVDDEPANRALIRAVLEREHVVVDAVDGPTALTAVEHEDVDLVLLDVMMPGMSGFDVCRAIKARPVPGLLPVILVTALTDQSDRNQGLEAGADEFLTKPFDQRELRLRVRTFLRLREQDAYIRAQLRELTELGQLKEDLVSMLVHDVRNPLAGVLATLELMAIGTDPTQLAEDLETVQSLCERMRQLLDEVLTVRQLEEGHLRAAREPTDVGELLRAAVATCTPAASARRVEILVTTSAGPRPSLDPGLTRRAVENLISNAIKFAPSGSAVLVAVDVMPEGARLAVSDRGPGVATEVRPRLFQKFGTLPAATGGGRKGFGLGLYFVKLVAAAHGGDVVATDREGGGSTFTLTLGGVA